MNLRKHILFYWLILSTLSLKNHSSSEKIMFQTLKKFPASERWFFFKVMHFLILWIYAIYAKKKKNKTRTFWKKKFQENAMPNRKVSTLNLPFSFCEENSLKPNHLKIINSKYWNANQLLLWNEAGGQDPKQKIILG